MEIKIILEFYSLPQQGAHTVLKTCGLREGRISAVSGEDNGGREPNALQMNAENVN